MYAFQYDYRVRAEQNKELMKEATYERWRHSIGPRRTSWERLGQRWIQQVSEWLEQRGRSIACDNALPECGLSPIG